MSNQRCVKKRLKKWYLHFKMLLFMNDTGVMCMFCVYFVNYFKNTVSLLFYIYIIYKKALIMKTSN